MSLFNSIIMGWPTGILIDASKGSPTDRNLGEGLDLQNNIIAGCPVPIAYAASTTQATGATAASILAWFNTPVFGNTIVTKNSDVKLGDAFNYSKPDVTPLSGSIALSGASFSNNLLKSGFSPVSFRGAAGLNDNWYKGWTKF